MESTTSGSTDFLDHLAREGAALTAAARDHLDEPVPSCPAWTVADLVRHVGQVLGRVAGIAQSGETARPDGGWPAAEPAPDTAGELPAWWGRQLSLLLTVLTGGDDDRPAWTWYPPDQTVGFWRRRMAHEVLIHRVDAEIAARARTPMDAELSADGVDEALRIMYGQVPGWATFAADGPRGTRVQTADTGRSWVVTSGRWSGTDPEDGSAVGEACLHVVDGGEGGGGAAGLEGSAGDLDCWLWGRPTCADLRRSGDAGVLAGVESVISRGVE